MDKYIDFVLIWSPFRSNSDPLLHATDKTVNGRLFLVM